jgi:hypothetical protein
MIYLAIACAVTGWILAVREMINDPDWDYEPDEYREP